MEEALVVLNDLNTNLFVRVAIFHYLFEYIHPFYNGNGRMGRYISSKYLVSELNPLCAFQLSIACLERQKDYYDAFKLVNDKRNKGDLTPFILMFLEIYLSRLKDLKSKVIFDSQIYLAYQKVLNKFIDKKFISILSPILLHTVFSTFSGLYMETLVSETGLTEQTLRKSIKVINKTYNNIITIQKTNKPYIYSIDYQVLESFNKS